MLLHSKQYTVSCRTTSLDCFMYKLLSYVTKLPVYKIYIENGSCTDSIVIMLYIKRFIS